MANHLRNLRGLRKHPGANHRDVLKNVPHFSMHIIRSATRTNELHTHCDGKWPHAFLIREINVYFGLG